MLGLIVTHAMVTFTAAAFGYLAVIGLRETMIAVLGRRWFTRVSPWAQGALIVVLGGSLLLLPLPPTASRSEGSRVGERVSAHVVSRRI